MNRGARNAAGDDAAVVAAVARSDESRRRQLLDVTCLGIITVDDVYTVERLPSGDSKSSAVDHRRVSGGVAANAAAAIAALGGRTRLIGCVGGDLAGSFVRQELVEMGVDVEVETILDRPTPSSAVMVDRAGGRMVVNHVAPGFFAGADPSRGVTIGRPRVVLVDCRWPAGARRALAAAADARIPSVVDIDRPLDRRHRDLLGLGSHLIFSRAALVATTGRTDLVESLHQIRSITDAWLAVTVGADGVWWLAGGESGHLDAHRVEAVDTLGAGDVFHGAFALELAISGSEAAALDFAGAVAAVKCQRAGGPRSFPDRTAVLDALGTHTPPRDREVHV